MLGQVAHLWRYPLKSLRGIELESAQVQHEGLAGDREAALIVATYGHPRAGKEYRGKEDNRLHLLTDGAAAQSAARERGVEAEVRAGGRFFDAAPISIIFDTWIAQGSRLCGVELEPLRFRPNIFVHAAAGFDSQEEALVGRRLRTGTCILEVTASIKRCVTPTYDLATGASNPAISRAIALQRENVMGIYCSVVQAGSLAVSDALHFAEA